MPKDGVAVTARGRVVRRDAGGATPHSSSGSCTVAPNSPESLEVRGNAILPLMAKRRLIVKWPRTKRANAVRACMGGTCDSTMLV